MDFIETFAEITSNFSPVALQYFVNGYLPVGCRILQCIITKW